MTNFPRTALRESGNPTLRTWEFQQTALDSRLRGNERTAAWARIGLISGTLLAAVPVAALAQNAVSDSPSAG